MKRMLWAIVVTVVTILVGTAAHPSAALINLLSGFAPKYGQGAFRAGRTTFEQDEIGLVE